MIHFFFWLSNIEENNTFSKHIWQIKDIMGRGTVGVFYSPSRLGKEDLALNNQQWLICHKTKPNQILYI